MKLETFFENFDLLTDAPNAATKLRELVLQLAVRGKLVEQDPADEPADVLLQKIIAKKSRLIKEKVIRKTKDFDLDDSVDLDSIPENWCWTNLSKVGLINPRNDLPDEQEVAFIPMNLVPQEYGKDISWEIRTWGEIKKGFTHFQEGDVALAKITPCFQNGKSCVMKGLPNHAGAGTTELHVFRKIGDLIYPEYVFLYFKSPKFLEEALPIMTGTAGQKRVPKEYVAANPFPLPPLVEQKRIVEACDRILTLCDKIDQHQQQRHDKLVKMNEVAIAKLLTAQTPDEFDIHWQHLWQNFDLLYSIPETIPKLRQAILQLAICGKLSQRDLGDISTSDSLQEMIEEKAQLVQLKKIRATKKLPSLDIESLPFEIPKHWLWVYVQDVGEVKLGRQRSPKDHFGPHMVPYLRVANVLENTLNLTDVKEMNFSPDEQEIFRLRHGDVLLNEGQSYELVGRPAIYRDEIPGVCFQNTLLRFRTYQNLVPDYALLVFRAYMHNGRFRDKAQQTTNIAHLSAGRLSSIEFPLPPLAEQKRIVAKVDRLMALCDAMEAKLTAARAQRETLMEAAARQVLAV